MAEETQNPALKEIFNRARISHLGEQVAAVWTPFDTSRFVALSTYELDDLSIMQRLRRISESLHAVLPDDFGEAIDILRRAAPRLDHAFAAMTFSEYAAVYGLDDPHVALPALADLTRYGSSEFAIRPFLKADLAGTLAVMTGWAQDENEHVRRLASEGCRPRLPWSFRLEALVADPTPAAAILETLKADPSLYVRKSVANHLNDIAKDHPDWVLDRVSAWDLENAHTAWIVRHALRTLVKAGDRRALAILGAGEPAKAEVRDLAVTPQAVRLGQSIALSFLLASTAERPQKLVVDYAIHYVKKGGKASRKVFKLKTLTLAARGVERLGRRQEIRDFSTRVHYPGRHEVEVLVNGETLGRTYFDILTGD